MGYVVTLKGFKHLHICGSCGIFCVKLKAWLYVFLISMQICQTRPSMTLLQIFPSIKLTTTAGLTLKFIHFLRSSVLAHFGVILGNYIHDSKAAWRGINRKPNGNMCRSQSPGLILSALISCRGISPHAGCPQRGDGSWGCRERQQNMFTSSQQEMRMRDYTILKSGTSTDRPQVPLKHYRSA